MSVVGTLDGYIDGSNNEYDLKDTTARGDITAIKDGTSIDSFGDVETALATKQNKTLDTALSIRGQSKTTVEAGLGGLLSWLNDLGLSVVDGALCVTYEE